MDIYFHQQSSSQVKKELKIVNASIIASLRCHQLLIFLPQIQDLKLFLHKGVISESPDMSSVLHVLSKCHMHIAQYSLCNEQNDPNQMAGEYQNRFFLLQIQLETKILFSILFFTSSLIHQNMNLNLNLINESRTIKYY